MFLRSARLPILVTCALAFSTLYIASVAAQQPKVLAPRPPVPPPRFPDDIQAPNPGTRDLTNGVQQ
jgi:hypothetical protein